MVVERDLLTYGTITGGTKVRLKGVGQVLFRRSPGKFWIQSGAM